MMTDDVKVLSAPLERVGALLERHITEHAGWTLGPVERELGEVRARALVGLGRAPDQVRFALAAGPDATTEIAADVISKSRWTRAVSARRRIEALLAAVSAALEA